jgi:hypothetical protein
MDANDLVVDPTSLAAYHTLAAGSAEHFATAAGLAESADPTLLAPAFGLIGGDLVAAYARVHTEHFDAAAKLSAAMRSMSAAVGDAAATYADSDRDHAEAIASAPDRDGEL